jgi:septum formation protein
MIYLASKSPRRTELLSQIGVEHQTIDIEVDEAINPKKSAKKNVASLSALKCQEGVRHILDQKKVIFPVLAADTIVVLEEEIFGKPESESDAISMLMKFSGKTHSVITGVTIGIVLSDKTEFHTVNAESKVGFAKLGLNDCKEYCKTNEPFDKAGGYGIQGYGSAFIKEIKGSYSNIVGLPIHEVAELFKKLKIPYWNKK